MKGRKHSPEQAVRKLAEGDRMLGEGKDLAEVLRHLEISDQTWHRCHLPALRDHPVASYGTTLRVHFDRPPRCSLRLGQSVKRAGSGTVLGLPAGRRLRASRAGGMTLLR